MTVNIDSTLIATAVSTIGILLSVAVAYGRHQVGLKEIHRRLDIINGTLKDHGIEISDQGERIATQEGRRGRG